MSSLLLRNGRVIDPANGVDGHLDLLIVEGKISAIGDSLSPPSSGCVSLNVAGAVVCPGLVDLHVHFREPGQSTKETIATGSRAAARGGFTTVVCMPNTSPAIDDAQTVMLVQEKIEREACINVFVAGAITRNLAGEELAPIGALRRAGVVALTDDGRCVQNNELMRRALEYARMVDLPVMDHCQDDSIVGRGVMHEGYWNLVLGLAGWPACGEELIVARNILLAELTGTWIHCQHVSAAGSVRLIREARQRGTPVSGEACPHHYVLTDAAVAGSDVFWRADGLGLLSSPGEALELPQWPPYDTRFKMNPPLRSAADREAVIEGVMDGTLEVLASDHAPHCRYEKEVEFDAAPFGIIGLETELSFSLMQFYHREKLSLSELIARYTTAPARILGLDKGSLHRGAGADVTVFDPDRNWVFDVNASASKSRNTPFENWPLKGQVQMTIVGGEIVWDRNSPRCVEPEKEARGRGLEYLNHGRQRSEV